MIRTFQCLILISLLPSATWAQDFTAQGCLQKIAATDENGRSCDQLAQLTQQACNTEDPVELKGGDQSKYDQAENQKKQAWADVRKLLDQGHQSAACEARRKGSEAEKTINEVKARNCEQLIQRCETSCSQMQQCASRLANVTETLGRIGSSYGSYTAGLRQDAQRAGQNVQQCKGLQSHVQQARQQAQIHGQNKEIEIICRDGTKKHEDNSSSFGTNVASGNGGGLTPPVSGSDGVSGGPGGSGGDDSMGRNNPSGPGNETLYPTGELGRSRGERGPASEKGLSANGAGAGHNFSSYHRKKGSGVGADGEDSDASGWNIFGRATEAFRRLTGGAKKAAAPKKKKEMELLGGRGRVAADGITPANGPDLFSKVRRRFVEEDRVGNWDPR